MGLEIHHIQPKAEGGINTEDNAAPLCPSCHRSFGGNRELRSRIREMRDDWYKKCEVLFTNGSRPNEVFNSIYETFSVEELERLTVHNPVYVLGTEETKCELESTSFSFHHEEYVHPFIVKELLGWISDSNSTVVSVDLGAANRSNRFLGDFSVNSDEAKALVECQDAEAKFVYRHVATTPSGVEVVECYDYGGGSGVFGTIGFFCLERDRALETEDGLRFSRKRKVLKILGQCGLGDRYDGDIQYNNGVLEVGPDKGWFKMGKEASWRLPVFQPEERLHLPATAAHLRDTQGWQRGVVGEKFQRFFALFVMILYALEFFRIVVRSFHTSEPHGSIADHTGATVNRVEVKSSQGGIGFGSKHKETAKLVQSENARKLSSLS